MNDRLKKSGAAGPKLSKLRLRKMIDSYFETEDGVKSLAGLALHIGIDKQTLENWLEDEQLGASSALGIAKTRIEKDIIENGLKGKYNATMASFLLKTTFGYRDREETKSGGPVRIEISEELKKYAV